MCNIAGYVGTRPAAPILIEMLRKQEGLNAGFYTGMATVCDGKIYYRKLVGDLQNLLDNTDVASLPGTVGFIHGRTPGDGDKEWGHPFVGERNGEIVTAYTLNGSAGCFKDNSLNVKIAEMLLEKGYHFRSRTFEKLQKETVPPLFDGSAVHASEIMSNLILHKLNQGMETAAAMEEAMCEYPKEVVGLLLTVEHPDRIAFSRFNMPMNVGFAEHGAYLASAALCFPEDAGYPLPIPAGSVGYVYKDHYEARPYKKLPGTIAPITARVRKEGYDTVVAALQEGNQTVPMLAKAVGPLYDPADCVQKAMLVYDILYSLQRDGKLKIDTVRIPGVTPDLTAPEFRLSLN